MKTYELRSSSEFLKRYIYNVNFPLVVFLVLSLVKVALPGLYMDSVNPDYFAAYITNPNNIPFWGYPDNMIFEDYKYPLLNSLYGGALPAYIGVLFYSLFGYSLFSVRLLHILFGAVIIFLCYKLLRFVSKSNKVAMITTLFIAIDPTYLFAWRTQYYLQLFPLLFFLVAIYLLILVIRSIQMETRLQTKKLVLSGVLVGLSALSYFIFAFYFLILLAVLCYYSFKVKLWMKSAVIYLGAFLLGYSIFIYAHISIMVNLGLTGYIGVLENMSRAYGVVDNLSNNFIDRIMHVKDIIVSLPGGEFISVVVFGTETVNFNQIIIVTIILLVLVSAIFMLMKKKNAFELPKEFIIFNKIIILLLFMQVMLGLIIGTSLNYQHYIMTLPFIYFLGSSAVYYIYLCVSQSNYKLPYITIVIISLLSLLAIQATNISKFYQDLDETGGVGFYDDSINRVAEFTSSINSDEVMIFPQWGYWMGAAIATGGKKEIWSLADISQIEEAINTRSAKSAYFVVLNSNQYENDVSILANNPSWDIKDIMVIKSRNGHSNSYIIKIER